MEQLEYPILFPAGGLVAATDLSSTHYASSAYATVYPIALIGMILFTKLLVLILQ